MSQAKEYIVKVKDPKFVDPLIAELHSWNVAVSNVSKVGFVGFSARMGTLISKWYKADDRIVAIEATTTYELQTVQTISSEFLWYLDRIDQPTLPLSGTYSYANTGAGVTIYTVDSGITPNHVELSGLVSPVYDPNFPSMIFDPVVDERIYENSADYNEAFPRGNDELGHGTFIAGLLVSPTYGVAKGARVRSAKVFGQTAVSSGRILAGLNAVHQDYISRNRPTSIVNLSLASLADPVSITSTSSSAPVNSSFIINAHQVSLSTGSVDEIVTKINALAITGIVATKVNTRLVISIKTLGAITLADGLHSPLAALGIAPGTYVNSPNLIEQSIMQMISDGMHVVISAGNYGIDAALVSPARIGQITSAIVVGATDNTDHLASFSNSGNVESSLGNINNTTLVNASVVGSCFGPAVSLYAPGVNMQSAWLSSYNVGTDLYNETMVGSGTSFASPLVAGALALALEPSNISPSNMKTNILNGASLGVISGLPSGSNNKLLNITSIDATITWINQSSFNSIPRYSQQEIFISAVSYMGVITQYSIEDGSLPVGLSLNSVTGKISGTVSGTNALGDYSVIFKAHNGLNNNPLDTNGLITLTFTVVEGITPAWWNNPENLGTVPEGDNINIILSADNKVEPSQPVTFSIVGNLPFGWILTGNQITGIAPIATNGDFNTSFTINANDGFTNTPRTFTLTIQQNQSYSSDNEPYWITPTGILGTFYEGNQISIQLNGFDNITDPRSLTYNLTVTDGDGSVFGPFGNFPSWLSLSSTGLITGQVPTLINDTESYEFAVYLSDGANVVANFFSIITLKADSVSTVIWDSIPGNIGSYYQNDLVSLTLLAHDTNGQPITYYLMSGNLPNGITFGADGTLTGTIENNEDDLYVFTVLAFNGHNGAYATFSILLNKINTAPVWVSGDNLGTYAEGSFINIELLATDADGDQLTYYSNDLPLGMYIRDQFLTGTLGSVDQDTVISFNITVSDILSNPTTYLEASKQFSLTIADGALNPNAPPYWLTPAGPLPSGITNQFYSTSLIAMDPEVQPLRYTLVDGILPPGLELDQINGIIIGTVDTIFQDTGYDFTINVTDGVFNVPRTFNIFISSALTNQPPVWVTGSNLGSITDGQPKVITLIASDPEGTKITYSYESGTLPPGILFNSTTGQLSGIPSITINQQTFQFVIRATDANLSSTDQQFNLTVVKVPNIAPIWITPSGQLSDSGGPIDFHPGDYVNFQFQATDPDGGPLALSYRLSNNSYLPYGISLSTSGLLTGYVGDVYSAQEVGFAVEVSDGADISSRNFIISFVPSSAYTGVSCDLYVPLSLDLKEVLNQWNNTDLISDSILYQPSDPQYGRSSNYDIFVTNNLHTGDKNQIQNILGPRHKTFSSLMGIPTYATGKDNYGNPLYEVIYIPMLDPQKGTVFDIPNQGDIQYYSHSFDNIRKEVLALTNNEFLPSWMRVSQDSKGTVLGYVPAIVLAYVQPGKAKTVIQTMTQIINQTNFNIQETTFDRHVLLAEKVEPSVSAGAQMAVEGVLVTFTGGDILSAKTDIENALLAQGINNIRIYIEDSVQYQYVSGKFVPVYGRALRFNYSNNYITLTDITGTPSSELGFKSQANVETTFDGQTIHFDYSLILDEKQNIQSDGLTFVGKELLFDRYVGHFSTGQNFQIKWAPEYQTPYYDNHKKEFWSANPPVWITPPGELGQIVTELPTTIQLRTKHHLVDQIVSYELVFGSLPPGFTLNSDTGIISGVAGVEGETTFFTVRAYDKWGNYKDRGFTLTVGANLLRIKQFIILINGYGVKI